MAATGDLCTLYECPVCLESLLDKKPRTLSCNHTFCEPCLASILNRQGINCPTCRMPTTVIHVSDLPVNTDLAKMKKREKTLVLMRDTICQICSLKEKIETAAYSCEDCNRTMCRGCRDQHDQTKIFKDHFVIPLSCDDNKSDVCADHCQLIKYVCLQCVDSLCGDCAFERKHCDHADRIVEFEEGVRIIRREHSAELMLSLMEKHSVIQECIDKLTDIASQEDDRRYLHDFKTINHFTKKEQLPTYDKTDVANKKVTENWNLVLSLLKWENMLLTKRSAEMAVSPDGNLFYADHGLKFVQRYHPRLGFLGKYHPHNSCDSQINDVCVFKNKLYIGQRTGISVIKLAAENQGAVELYKPKTSNITSFAVLDDSLVYISNHKAGQIVKFHIQQNRTGVCISKLRNPQDIDIIREESGEHWFVVCENLNKIIIFDKDWNQTASVTSNITVATSITSPLVSAASLKSQITTASRLIPAGQSRSGHFLVVDTSSHAVKEYKVDGSLVGRVLTTRQSLDQPVMAAYCSPYLWVLDAAGFKMFQAPT